MVHHCFNRADCIEVIEAVEERGDWVGFPVGIDEWDGDDWGIDADGVIASLLVAFRIIILNRDILLELIDFELNDEAAVNNNGVDI